MAKTTRTSQEPTQALRIAVLVLEQTLGHVTHTKNLQALLPTDRGLVPEFVLVPFDTGQRRIPGWSNWTVRAGVRAGIRLARRRRSQRPPDVMFVHTQVPAMLLGPWMRRTPTVVSIDATPKQYDDLGEHYAHTPGHPRIESLKSNANRRCFERAAHLVSWSEWGKRGLVDGYGIDPDKVTVISPGVDVDRWSRVPATRSDDSPVRILFVGGDLRRKGGDLLIEAIRVLRSNPQMPEVELHLVTTADVDDQPGVVVHRGLTANSPDLIAQYHQADIFCLPTLGDCLPMVLAEAAAASLPLVSTDVGAIREIVRPGETGELIAPGDLAALVDALGRLVSDQSLRVRYGSAANALARSDHDAGYNATRIMDLLISAADRTGAT